MRPTPDVADRVFKFTERQERLLIDRMRDLDEIRACANRMLPGKKRWSRIELMLLFFLDDMGDSLQALASAGNEDGF